MINNLGKLFREYSKIKLCNLFYEVNVILVINLDKENILKI